MAETAAGTARRTAATDRWRRLGHGEAADRCADRRAASRPGEAAGPRARPGLRDVRRHDAAHRLVLHVLELREQHGLRLSEEFSRSRATATEQPGVITAGLGTPA